VGRVPVDHSDLAAFDLEVGKSFQHTSKVQERGESVFKTFAVILSGLSVVVG
jgi:hypothetical protein